MKLPRILNIGILYTSILLSSCVSTLQVNNDLDRQSQALRAQLASEQRKSITLADEKAKLERQKVLLDQKPRSPDRDEAIQKVVENIRTNSGEEAKVKQEIADLKHKLETY